MMFFPPPSCNPQTPPPWWAVLAPFAAIALVFILAWVLKI